MQTLYMYAQIYSKEMFKLLTAIEPETVNSPLLSPLLLVFILLLFFPVAGIDMPGGSNEGLRWDRLAEGGKLPMNYNDE